MTFHYGYGTSHGARGYCGAYASPLSRVSLDLKPYTPEDVCEFCAALVVELLISGSTMYLQRCSMCLGLGHRAVPTTAETGCFSCSNVGWYRVKVAKP